MTEPKALKNHLVRFAVLLALFSVSCRRETPAPATSSSTSSTAQAAPSPIAEVTPFVFESGDSVEVGSMMPPFQSKFLDGKPFKLSDKRGKVLLLNIWATWCGPCRYEIPELQALHQELAGRGFEVIGVSVDDFGMEPSIREFVASKKMTYPVIHDPDGSVAALFNSTVIPTSALIDREGRVRWVHSGVVLRGNPALRKALAEAM